MALALADIWKTATVEINLARVKVARNFQQDVFQILNGMLCTAMVVRAVVLGASALAA